MIRQLARSIREYTRPSVFTSLFMIAEVVMEVTIPFLMADLIDNGVSKADPARLIKTGVILVFLCLLAMFFGLMCGRFGAIASTGFAKNLRKDMFSKVQDYSFSNIDKFSTASIITRITMDVNYIQDTYQLILRMAVRSPIMFTFSLIMAFRIKSQLAMVFLIFIPILAAGLILTFSKAYPIFKKVFEEFDVSSNVVQENLLGIRVVKTFVREDFEKQKYYKVSDSIYRKFVKADRIVAFNAPLMTICMYACTLLISWFGTLFIVSHTMSTGNLMSLITYTLQILNSLMMFSQVLIMMTITRGPAQRVSEILEEKPSITSAPSAVMEVNDGSIEFNDVSFSYTGDKNKLCLMDINLKINSGDTIGIIGGTGSSKSTLVQLIPRLYEASSGEVMVGGVNVKEYDLKTLRDQVAMVLQKNTLFEGTIAENLRWGNENATEEEILHVCTVTQSIGFISEFPDGLNSHVEQGGVNLSGGQRQRLCIARAMLKNPKIIIMDDSTSAVDTKTDSMIRTSFREEIPDTTKIIIAQRISSISDADKIIIMKSGRIDAMGTHDELLKTNEIYKEIYTSQMKEGDE